MDNNFKENLKNRAEQAEKIIRENLPTQAGFAKTVTDAMNYSVLAGGKRLRPVFMMESYRAVNGDASGCVPPLLGIFMTAMECIHSYSLVHDDLPAMDNDEYRRGKETTWKVYGDGMGVLAGDGLLNYAFELISEGIDRCAEMEKDVSGKLAIYSRGIKAEKVLADKAGFLGMIGGQCADLEAENKADKISKEQLLFIHEHKTGCLIEAALMAGAILAGADDVTVSLLEKCGSDIGIAFQIRDDILDIIGDSAELGKKVGSDEANGKTTYVTLNGLEASEKEVERLSNEAKEIVGKLSGETAFLTDLIDSLVNRSK